MRVCSVLLLGSAAYAAIRGSIFIAKGFSATVVMVWEIRQQSRRIGQAERHPVRFAV